MRRNALRSIVGIGPVDGDAGLASEFTDRLVVHGAGSRKTAVLRAAIVALAVASGCVAKRQAPAGTADGWTWVPRLTAMLRTVPSPIRHCAVTASDPTASPP